VCVCVCVCVCVFVCMCVCVCVTAATGLYKCTHCDWLFTKNAYNLEGTPHIPEFRENTDWMICACGCDEKLDFVRNQCTICVLLLCFAILQCVQQHSSHHVVSSSFPELKCSKIILSWKIIAARNVKFVSTVVVCKRVNDIFTCTEIHSP